MLILTYHRIVASEVDATDDFYRVSVDVLRQHLQLARKKGFEPATVDDLLGGATPEKRFLVSFDDGTIDHLRLAAPVLEELGLKGLFFISTALLGEDGFMTRDDLRELVRRGHELGCHSHEHLRLDELSVDQIERQLRISCELLSGIQGREIRTLAPPGGYTSSKVRAAAKAVGLKVVRTMRWGLNSKVHLDDLATISPNASLSLSLFEGLLDGKHFSRLRAIFIAKEVIKALMPIRLYVRLRAKVFPS